MEYWDVWKCPSYDVGLPEVLFKTSFKLLHRKLCCTLIPANMHFNGHILFSCILYCNLFNFYPYHPILQGWINYLLLIFNFSYIMYRNYCNHKNKSDTNQTNRDFNWSFELLQHIFFILAYWIYRWVWESHMGPTPDSA